MDTFDSNSVGFRFWTSAWRESFNLEDDAFQEDAVAEEVPAVGGQLGITFVGFCRSEQEFLGEPPLTSSFAHIHRALVEGRTLHHSLHLRA